MSALPDTIAQLPSKRSASGRPATSIVRAIRSRLPERLPWNGLLALVDQAFFSGTNFLTVVIIGRNCAPEVLGDYQLVLGFVLMAYLFQDALICAPYRIYCHRRRGNGLAKYTGSSLVHQVCLSIAMIGVLSLLLGALSAGFGPSALAPAIWGLLPFAPFVLLREFVRRVSFARLKVVTAVLLDGAVCSLQLGGLLWFARTGSLDLLRIYLVIGASCAVAALIAFALKALPVRISRSRVASDWRQNWGFSKWTLGSLLLANTTPLLLMPWLLALTHGEASTGILAACGSLVGLANTFLIGIDNVLGPKSAHSYARGGLSDLWRIARNCTLLLAGVLGVFCLALFIADDWLSVTVYGRQYEGTGLVVRLLGLNIFMAAMGLAPGNALWAMERPAGNFRASAVDVAVTLIVAAALVVPFGVVGAAAATLAGTSAGTVARWAMFVRASRLASPAIATT